MYVLNSYINIYVLTTYAPLCIHLCRGIINVMRMKFKLKPIPKGKPKRMTENLKNESQEERFRFVDFTRWTFGENCRSVFFYNSYINHTKNNDYANAYALYRKVINKPARWQCSKFEFGEKFISDSVKRKQNLYFSISFKLFCCLIHSHLKHKSVYWMDNNQWLCGYTSIWPLIWSLDFIKCYFFNNIISL